MALNWLIEDMPAFLTRGQRIQSVLDGSGSVEIIPGRPDVEAQVSDFDKGENYNPEIPFDPNAFMRMDKFDAVEAGQELIDSTIDFSKSKGDPSTDPAKEK